MKIRADSLANGMLLLFLAVSCLVVNLPESNQHLVRNRLRDAVIPLIQQAEQVIEPRVPSPISETIIKDKSAGQQEWISEKERLTRQLTILRQQIATKAQQNFSAETSTQLFQPHLVTARVLLDQQTQNWKQGHWLLAGRRSAIAEQDWVLKSELPLLDIGTDYQLTPDQVVLAGRFIIGQVDQVGHWSSSYRPITHADFRCPATVMNRQTGRIQAAAASLHGTGENVCELNYLENTFPVSPGDFVVLADPEQRFEVPLVLGTVIAAEIEESSPFWKIQVEPAAARSDQRQVQIVTERLNPARLTSASPATETQKE